MNQADTLPDDLAPLLATSISAVAEPLALLQQWLTEAERTELNDANAMTLATLDANQKLNVRVVLLKEASEAGLVFYTNSHSRKGQALAATPQAALNFHWKSLRRQVRVRGAVSMVSGSEADAYFATRPRGSQLGAWASAQSAPLANRADLLNAYQDYEKRFRGQAVPRPAHWNGYRVAPDYYEFWQDLPWRLHDRLEYWQENGRWLHQRLSP